MKPRKLVGNKSIKMHMMYDVGNRSPYDEWDQASVPLFFRRHTRLLEDKIGHDITWYADDMDYDDFIEFAEEHDEDEICKYLARYGVAATPLYDGYDVLIGFAVMGPREMKNEATRDFNHALMLTKAEADEYGMWSRGEVYGILAEEDDEPDSRDQRNPDLIYSHDGMNIVDSTWGYYGDDSATEAANDMFDYLVDGRADRRKEEAARPISARKFRVTQTMVGDRGLPHSQIKKLGVGDSMTLPDGRFVVRDYAKRRKAKKPKAKAKRRI